MNNQTQYSYFSFNPYVYDKKNKVHFFSFSQASTNELSMSLAQVAWPFSPACTWRPVMCQSPPSGPVLNLKPPTLGKAVIATLTLRSLCTSCVVNNTEMDKSLFLYKYS